MKNLNKTEKKVITKFKNELSDRFPKEIVDVLLFGSKARGDYRNESDIDVLVVTRNDDWRLTDRIRKVGYSLDEKIDYKLSIQVFSEKKLDYLRENGFQFAINVYRDALYV